MKRVILLHRTRQRRAVKTRAKIFGTLSRPRLAVFRSNRYSYVQLIDDVKGVTLASASTKELVKAGHKKDKTTTAQQLGALIGERAKEKGISQAVFDRRSYRYHGRVKAIAEGARKSGLAF